MTWRSAPARAPAFAIVAALAIGSAIPSNGLAQTGPFESLDLNLRVASDVNHAAFHDFWNPGLGVEASLAFPFYAGALRIGVQQFHNEPIGAAVGFRSRYFHGGWDGGLTVAPGLTWRTGVHAGLYHVWFDADTIPEFSRSESEFAVGGRSLLEYALGSRWLVGASADYQLVLTHERIHRVMLGVGLGYRFTSPGWLRDFLR
jgi:hypothetical protein